ncbi:hypothetical protein AMJ40_03975 [candidate division TA06 bacterium DG_26]|uniref:Uncharacterized protein n=1 Tax=candidate division TA06 bacterium DG_26 TaxID=1703771 RepID=A0A0S7WJ06_UNCT6|nr:MAG: hypothetical protein AMJ40_03975 [candidate division TA06 bacterium DG_26]
MPACIQSSAVDHRKDFGFLLGEGRERHDSISSQLPMARQRVAFAWPMKNVFSVRTTEVTHEDIRTPFDS